MKTPNLRDFHPDDSQAKFVEDTNMLDTTAREPAETVKTKNTLTEEVTSHPTFGPLGTTGRAG